MGILLFIYVWLTYILFWPMGLLELLGVQIQYEGMAIPFYIFGIILYLMTMTGFYYFIIKYTLKFIGKKSPQIRYFFYIIFIVGVILLSIDILNDLEGWGM